MTTEKSYRPQEIFYTIRTCRWLLQNLVTLRLGTWPAEASSYVDMSDIFAQSHQASFITAVECVAEVTARLEMCGKDGLILLAIEGWEETPESLSIYLKMPVWSVLKRKKKALRYISSGPVRRWHDSKKRKAVDYSDFER